MEAIFISSKDYSYYFDYLREVRRAKRKSLTDVARASQIGADAATRISVPALSKIERGFVRTPSIGTVLKLVRGYGVPLESLTPFFDDCPRGVAAQAAA